jgi:hypothetical protein
MNELIVSFPDGGFATTGKEIRNPAPTRMHPGGTGLTRRKLEKWRELVRPF